ncbi:MAG: ABC-2 family transporter protein [Patescibacteria group bacterium]
MHKLLRLWLASWARALTYRGDIFFWSLTEIVTPLVALAIWYTVSRTSAGPFTPQETITYYILAIFTLSMTNVWNGFFLIQEIQNGKVVQQLIRPIGFFWYHLGRNLTAKIIRLVPQTIAFGIIFAIFASSLSPTVFELRNILFFLATIGAGLTIAFILDMAFAMLAFWIEDAIQIREYKEVISNIASGLLVPIAFMPESLQTIFNWLPFRYIISAPIEIMLGQAPGAEAWKLLGIQVVWIGMCAVLLRALWRKGLKVYVVPGQ